MRLPYNIILVFLGISLLTMGFQCGKEDYTVSPPIYQFAEKLTLVPYKKVYSINDTIWVQFQTSDKTLFDQLTNTRIATDTTFLQIGFNLYRRFPNGSMVELFSDVKLENGLDMSFAPLYTYYNVLKFITDCNNHRYFFRAGFVPKKTGVYSIEPSGIISPCPNKLSFPYSSFRFTFDLADCNKDVWLSIPSASRGGQMGYTDVSIDKKEIFVFKVE